MATTDATLVLQDLLSPPASDLPPPPTLAQLVALHLGSLPLSEPHINLVPLLVRYFLRSPALWSNIPHTEQWDRRRIAFDAARQAVLLRLDSLARPPPKSEPARTASASSSSASQNGWSTRRSVHTFLRQVDSGLWADPTSSVPGDHGVEPLVRLAFASGLLAALQEWKRRKEKLWVGGRSGINGAENTVGRAWHEWTEAQPRAAAEPDGFPAWLAAQTLPFVQVEELAANWNAPAVLTHLTEAFSSAFDHGRAFSTPPLGSDLSDSPEGLAWTVPSASHAHLSALVQRPLFISLGPLSRALGRALEATALVARSRTGNGIASQAAISAIHNLSNVMLAVASTLSSDWAATPWSDHRDENSLAPSTRTNGTAPWTLLKTLLFSQTLVYSSLLEIVSSSMDAVPKSLQRDLASTAVQALAKTYFVALRFGQSGFEAWRAVLAGLVEVATAPDGVTDDLAAKGGRVGDALISPAEQLVRSLQPVKLGLHERVVERAEATFWLNTAEQVLRIVGDDSVEGVVLRGCRPYLDDATYRDSFEAAHSVVLAVFSNNKRCASEVAPWYIHLVLRIYPSLLSATQLRVAYAAAVCAATDTGDDGLAWWCVEELLARIDALPIAAASPAVGTVSGPIDPLRNLAEDQDGSEQAAASGPAPPSVSAAVDGSEPAANTDETVTPRDARVLTLPRGAHLLVLASLLPSVSLSVLPLVLSALEVRVRLEPRGSDGRAALVEGVFEVLGTGMDAVKRGEGVRWWLERGRGLLTGGPIEEDEKEVATPSEKSQPSEHQADTHAGAKDGIELSAKL